MPKTAEIKVNTYALFVSCSTKSAHILLIVISTVFFQFLLHFLSTPPSFIMNKRNLVDLINLIFLLTKKVVTIVFYYNKIHYLSLFMRNALFNRLQEKQIVQSAVLISRLHSVLCQRFKTFLYPFFIILTSLYSAEKGNPWQNNEVKNTVAKSINSSSDVIIFGAPNSLLMKKHWISLFPSVVLISFIGVNLAVEWFDNIISTKHFIPPMVWTERFFNDLSKDGNESNTFHSWEDEKFVSTAVLSVK